MLFRGRLQGVFLGIYFVLVFEKHGQMATINDTSKSKPDVAVDRKFD